jgi:hypothetical protein
MYSWLEQVVVVVEMAVAAVVVVPQFQELLLL